MIVVSNPWLPEGRQVLIRNDAVVWIGDLGQPIEDVELCLAKRALAVKHGAIEVDRRGLVDVKRRHRDKFMSDPAELAAIREAAARSAKPLA